LTDEQTSALKEPGGKTWSGIFTPEEQAVLRYTDLLTTRPENIEAADLEALSAHFDEQQIIELALVIATANWTTRINEGLQVPWTDTGADG
jgi:alkylhydroperoxidase family enzyme